MFIVYDRHGKCKLSYTRSVRWQDCFTKMVDNHSQLEYLHRDEVEDIVQCDFIESGLGDRYELLEED